MGQYETDCIRDAYADAARRERHFGTAKLVLADVASIGAPDAAVPTLDEFIAKYDRLHTHTAGTGMALGHHVGSQGKFQGPREHCMMRASNDHGAVLLGIKTRQGMWPEQKRAFQIRRGIEPCAQEAPLDWLGDLSHTPART